MDRPGMLLKLEEFWRAQQERHPEEAIDIPAAMEYYRSLPTSCLRVEYLAKCG